jgi:23S rRNA (cytidine2498-2'-O)-methyltransferase
VNDVHDTSLCLICRQGFESTLADEVHAKMLASGRAGGVPEMLPGLLRYSGPQAAAMAGDAPFIFERQRLSGALRIGMDALKPMAREVMVRVLPGIPRGTGQWTLHAYASNVDAADSLARRADSLAEVFLQGCHERFPGILRRHVPPQAAGAAVHVLQICVTREAAWACVMEKSQLSDAAPGGVHRMPFDQQSPSRSYLKIEEALDLMNDAPKRKQTVVDLGAAPGGWSYAFLKRGCRVVAVDNGPMRLENTGGQGGTLKHEEEDGLVYEPPRELRPLDWLVSDMLMPPGRNLGMMRKWMDGRWMRRFVINIKLPQERPYEVLQPVEEYLASVPRIRFRIRQLYHDRREVTVFGRLE